MFMEDFNYNSYSMNTWWNEWLSEYAHSLVFEMSCLTVKTKKQDSMPIRNKWEGDDEREGNMGRNQEIFRKPEAHYKSRAFVSVSNVA